MHLSEGVLQIPTLAAGIVVATVGVLLGLHRLDAERLSFTALFASVFFVAATIHVPVGIGSVHLILNGMAGLFLGWAVFPAFLIALLLQALLFSFGGIAVLGVNLCIMALPALGAHYLFRRCLRAAISVPQRIMIGIGCGVIGVGGSALCASLILALDGGKSYSDLIVLLLLSHLPVFVADSVVSVGVLLTLAKMSPNALVRKP